MLNINALLLATLCGATASAQPVTVSCVTISSGSASHPTHALNLGQPMIGLASGPSGTPTLHLGVIACLAEGCYPDCDADGTLSIDDFICFQTYFAIGDPYADCDGDAVLSIDDFICFQTFFAIGC